MNDKAIVAIILSAYTYYFMSNVLKHTKADTELTKNEKIQTILLLIINTLFSWFILYFGWKNKLPTKAKQVTTYLLRIVCMLVGIAILGIIVSVLLVAINPNKQIEKARITTITPTISVTK